jgi:glyoxylate/hydroxypyruvate reductase A
MTERVMVVRTGGAKGFAAWRDCMATRDPALRLITWEEAAERPQDVDYALLWDPPGGLLPRMDKLKLIFSSGAGVDGILACPDVPQHVPIVRNAVPGATQRMGEFCAWAVLSLLKEARRMAIAQAENRWEYFDPEYSAPERTVGIMGLGAMGTRSAEMLLGLGFNVIGWSRTRKAVPGVESYAGDAELPAFLARTNILVSLLPATPETRHIINATTLGLMPPGGGYIGLGRGMQQDQDAILAALHSGQLSGAVLDVFDPEPLPTTHPFWNHPKVTVTAHLASIATIPERADFMLATMAAQDRGETLPNLFDPARGY